MFPIPLFAGVGLGVAILLALARVDGARGNEKTWRGYLNAAGAGIVLGAMFDLLPKTLEIAGVLFATVLRTQVITPLNAAPDSFLAIGAGVISQAVTPLGALLVLFLYLSGNSAPMPVEGRISGTPKAGWRARLSIPAAGQVDWKGIGIITIGLGAHNLWLGQVRGALALNSDRSFTSFYLTFGLISTLRTFAIAGSLVDTRKRWLALLGGALLIVGAGVFGVASPDGARTIELGIVPLFIAILTLPIALGRILRVIENDIGLKWQTTAAVLAALGVERGLSYLLLLIVQGQLG